MANPIRFPRRNVVFALTRLIVNQLLPLAVLPLMLGRLGSQPFGELMIAQAVGWYLVVIVEYGFNLTGVRSVTLERHDKNRLSALLIEIGTVRLLIAAILAVLLAAAGWSGLFDPTLTLLVVVGFSAALGAAIQPIWFFQGLEKFPLISVVQMFSRAACLGSIFWLVQGPGDLLVAQFLLSAPFLLSALVLAPVAHRYYRSTDPRTWRLTFQDLAHHLRDGLDVFLSQIATTLFTSTNTIVLGGVLDASAAGHYTLADKIVRGIAMLTTPVTEAIYPRIVANLRSAQTQTLAFARRVLIVGVALLGTASTGLMMLAPFVAEAVGGTSGAPEISLALTIMAFIPAAIFANNICGTQILLGLGYKRQFRNIILMAGAVVPLSSLILVPYYGFVGAPIGALLGETLIIFLMLFGSIRAVGRNWLKPDHA